MRGKGKGGGTARIRERMRSVGHTDDYWCNQYTIARMYTNIYTYTYFVATARYEFSGASSRAARDVIESRRR